MNTLRVLVVEEDQSVLNTCCSWLIDEGCEVSTQRTAANIQQCMRRARAEIVLIDPLMSDLSSEELVLLLARCQHPGAPSIILHSRLSEQLLHLVVDPKNARGIIHKTNNAAEFLRAFRALTRATWSMPARPASATSGTHRIDGMGELVVLSRARQGR
ncbi:MAG: hypothetical protein ACOY0T_18395 [Myxococcota bacterium]